MANFKYVDLGLPSGTLWADNNLPGYYAFGELDEKFTYTQENSITYNKSKTQLFKEGILDAQGNLISKHSYTIPTKEQFLELMNHCEWKWDSTKLGYEIKSKNNDPKYLDKSIFLPTNGYKLKTDIVDEGIWGNYWTSTLIDGKYQAAYLYFFKNAIYWGNHSERFYGRSIRPVLNTKCNALLDLGLTSGTLWDSLPYGASNNLEKGTIVAFGEDKEKQIYDLDHWEFAVKDEDEWRYRFADDMSTKSMWDKVLNYRNVETQCLKNRPDTAWYNNTTDKQEPTKEDYEELQANIESTEDVIINEIPVRLIYFNNSIEVLICVAGMHGEEGYSNAYGYWTKSLIIHDNLYDSAYFWTTSTCLDSPLSNGFQIRRIKKK